MRMLFRTILAILITAFLAQGALALEISPGSVSGGAGSTVVVPVNISDVGADLEVDAFGFTIQYDDSVLTFSEVTKDGTLTSGFTLVNGQVTSPGNAKVSGAFFGGSANITEPGLFLNVSFTINADATTGSDISLIEFKDDISDAATTDGAVTLGAPNTPPTAQAGTLTVAPGATATGTLSATDADGDTLTFSIQTNPTQGTVAITDENTGAYQFVANAAATGTDSFTFQVSDGIDTDTATVNVTYGANNPPVAQDGSLTVAPGATATGTLMATDADGDTPTFTIQTNGAKGTATITGANTGAYEYAAIADASGTDSFTFIVSDGKGGTDTGTVTVTFEADNNAPVAQDGALTVAAGDTADGTLVATDADGDALTYSIQTNGTQGTAVVANASTGAYSYTADTGASGTDSFTFLVSDGQGGSDIGTITVSINQAPCVAEIAVEKYEGLNLTFTKGDSTGTVEVDYGLNQGFVPFTAGPVQYPAAGDYSVSVKATNAQNDTCEDQIQATIYKPTISSPQSPTGLTPTLSVDDQSLPPFLEEIMWKIDNQDSGEVVLDNSIDGSETTLTVPELKLDSDVNYTWTAQFSYGDFGYSVISEDGNFKTAADVEPFADNNQDGVPDDQEFPGMPSSDGEKTVANNEGGWVKFKVVDADNDGTTSTILNAKRASGDTLTDLPQGRELFEGPYTVKVEETDPDDTLKLTLSDPLPADRNPVVYLRGNDGTLKELTDAFAGDLMSSTFSVLDGSGFDRDGAQNGEVLLEDVVVLVDPETVCAGTVTIFANDVTGSGGGTGDFSDTVPFVVDFTASVSGGPEEGYTYTWTIEGETFTGQSVDNYTFDMTGDFEVVVEASKEGCPTLTDTKTVSVGEFHDDNCFIAASAVGATGLFSFAALLAGLAGAIAWRKRR